MSTPGPSEVSTLWPDDAETSLEVVRPGTQGPDLDMAIALLAAGCTQSYVRQKCGFESQRAVQAFCRDAETRSAVAALTTERASRVGKRALVALEQIVTAPQTDLRAHVLAIRTALEVSGDLKRDHAAPVKSVRELSVDELSTLIDATRQELDARITRQRAGEGKQ